MNKNTIKTKKVLVSSCVAGLAIATAVTSAHAAGSTFVGNSRYDTAAKVAEAGWTTTSQVAILAPGENTHLVDALAAAPLAKAYNAPILLTESNKSALNPSTVSELKRLGVTTVYITSGTINKDDVTPALKDAGVQNIVQLGGKNRFETAYNIAQQVATKNGSVNGVFIVGYNGTPDALSASSIAAEKGMPILFADSSSVVPESVKSFIAAKNVTTKYVLGGTGVVSDSVVTALNATRLAGQTRYDTSAAILNQFKADYDLSNVYVASGDNSHIVDALSISALAAKGTKSNPVIISTTELSGMPAATIDFLKANLTSDSNINGVGGAVTSALLSSIEALKPAPVIKSGITSITAENTGIPYEMSVKVYVNTPDVTKTTVTYLPSNKVLTYNATDKAFEGIVPAATLEDAKNIANYKADVPAVENAAVNVTDAEVPFFGKVYVEVTLSGTSNPQNYTVKHGTTELTYDATKKVFYGIVTAMDTDTAKDTTKYTVTLK